MKQSSFDPSAPLPDFVLEQFLKETEKEEKKEEEENIVLPKNIAVLADPNKIKEERKERARKNLDEMMEKRKSRRVNYGTILANKSKKRVPAADFAGKGK